MRLGPSGRRAAARVPSLLVSQEVLEHLEVQRLIGNNALEASVFILELLETACLGGVHATVLLAPAVERVRADAMPAAQLTRLCTGIRFRQDGDDLLFRIPTLPHDSSLAKESHYNWIRFRGSGHINRHLWASPGNPVEGGEALSVSGGS